MKNLLLVDDDFDFLNTLSSILKRDFLISTATGVAETKQILMFEAVDAVCSDFGMGDGTGLELLEQLREKGNTIPFLLLSGTKDAVLINKVDCYDAAFCSKTDYDLVETIKNAINFKTM